MVRQRNNCAIPFTMCLLSIVLLCGCISVTAARAATSHPIASLKESEIAPSAEKAPRSFWIKLTLGAIIRWGRRDVDSIKNETNEFFQTVTSGVHDGISRIVKFSIVMFNCSIVSYSNNFMNSTAANKSSGSSETEDFMVLTDSDGGLFQLNDEGDNQCEDLSIIILKVLKAVVIGIAVAILTALLLPLVLRLLLFIIGFITYGISVVSCTAICQPKKGNVKGKSCFTWCQSLGASSVQHLYKRRFRPILVFVGICTGCLSGWIVWPYL